MAIGVADSLLSASGHWEGTIQIPEHEFSITIDLARDSKGEWAGSMSVLGSSSKDVPLTAIRVQDTEVRFSANLPENASFEGRLSGDAGKLSGTVSNFEGSAPFELVRRGDARVKVPPPSSPLSSEFAGEWDGVLGNAGKHVGLNLIAGEDGTAAGILTATGTGAGGKVKIPVTTVMISNRQLQLEVRAVSGTYRGSLGMSGEISGEWLQGDTRVPLTFKRVGERPRL